MTIGIEIVAVASVISFAGGAVTSYILGKYKNPDLDGDGKIEVEELKTIFNDAVGTFDAYKDAVEDIIEDADIPPEEAIAHLKNISKIFKK